MQHRCYRPRSRRLRGRCGAGLPSPCEAAARTLTALRFFRDSSQGEEPDATGYRGFYYHFLDLRTGRRVWQCELSMMDTAILIAGVLTSGAYYSAAADDEREIRETRPVPLRANRLALGCGRRGPGTVDGMEAGNRLPELRLGGYSEAMLLYILGLGSPTHPLPGDSYGAWTGSYQWENLYDIDVLFGGPLFIHQLSHLWVDFVVSRTHSCGPNVPTISRTAAGPP